MIIYQFIICVRLEEIVRFYSFVENIVSGSILLDSRRYVLFPILYARVFKTVYVVHCCMGNEWSRNTSVFGNRCMVREEIERCELVVLHLICT